MSEQAPAGWYPDGQGNERFWDGAAWTVQTRSPETSPAAPAVKKGGAFTKLGSRIKQVAAEKQAAKAEFNRAQEEVAQAAGALVTSGVFGTSTVEIYENGYIRVAAGTADHEQAVKITKKTPYEQLRSIKYTPSGSQKRSEGTEPSALMKGASALMKGGSLMKASVPGLVVAGISQVAAAEAGKSILTIATDKQIYSLTNQSHNGFMKTSNKAHNEVGVALEAAGHSVLAAHGLIVPESQSQPGSTAAAQPAAAPQAAGPSVGDRLRELAALHSDGILSGEEFASAKAKLLGDL